MLSVGQVKRETASEGVSLSIDSTVSILVTQYQLNLVMSKNLICVEFLDDCIFWILSQSDIDKVMKYLKDYGTRYNWEH